jgi:hypothetical protein
MPTETPTCCLLHQTTAKNSPLSHELPLPPRRPRSPPQTLPGPPLACPSPPARPRSRTPRYDSPASWIRSTATCCLAVLGTVPKVSPQGTPNCWDLNEQLQEVTENAAASTCVPCAAAWIRPHSAALQTRRPDVAMAQQNSEPTP